MFFLFSAKIIDNKKKGKLKMTDENKISAKQELIEFIHNLTDEEVKLFLSVFQDDTKNEQP